ncbi:unnamed protein product, partial [Pocillopora meandrina]
VQYLVKWKGYGRFHTSWEDEENLTTNLIRYLLLYHFFKLLKLPLQLDMLKYRKHMTSQLLTKRG